MSRIFKSILMIGTVGYLAFRYKYRLLNVLIGTGWVRRLAVGFAQKLPFSRNKLMQFVFGGPSEW